MFKKVFLGLVLELLDGAANAWTVVVIHAIEMVLVVFGSPFRDEMVRALPLIFLPCSCGVQRGQLADNAQSSNRRF